MLGLLLECLRQASNSLYFLSMSLFMSFQVIFPRANLFMPSAPIWVACNSLRTSSLFPVGITTSSPFFMTRLHPFAQVKVLRYCLSLPILNNSLSFSISSKVCCSLCGESLSDKQCLPEHSLPVLPV